MPHRFRTTDKTSPAARRRAAEYATPAYKAAGQAALLRIQAGHGQCWRCGRHIPPTARRGPDWQLGHDDHNRTIIRGEECTRCNRTAAAKAGYQASRRHQPRRAQSRRWA